MLYVAVCEVETYRQVGVECSLHRILRSEGAGPAWVVTCKLLKPPISGISDKIAELFLALLVSIATSAMRIVPPMHPFGQR